jgi:hypothetical protein
MDVIERAMDVPGARDATTLYEVIHNPPITSNMSVTLPDCYW